MLVMTLLATPLFGQEPARALDVSSQQERRYFGEPIDLSLRDADLVETLRSFAEIGGFNLLIDPSVQGTVTVELKSVPWDLALEQILKIHRLGMEVDGRVISVASATAPVDQSWNRLRVVRLNLRYADAAVVAQVLKQTSSGILTTDGHVWTEPGNTLAIQETGVRLLHLGRLLSRLDIPSAAEEEPPDLEQRCLAVWRKLIGNG